MKKTDLLRPLLAIIALSAASCATKPATAPSSTPQTSPQETSEYLAWYATGQDRDLTYMTAWIRDDQGRAEVQKVKEGLFIAHDDHLWQMKLTASEKLPLFDPSCYREAVDELLEDDQDQSPFKPEDFAHCQIKEEDLQSLTFQDLTTHKSLTSQVLREDKRYEILDEFRPTYRVLGAAAGKIYVDQCIFQSPIGAAHPAFDCEFLIFDLQEEALLSAEDLKDKWQSAPELDQARKEALEKLRQELDPPCDDELPEQPQELAIVAWWPDWTTDELMTGYRLGVDASWACSPMDWSGYFASTTLLSPALSPELNSLERTAPQAVQDYWERQTHPTFRGFSQITGDKERLFSAFEDARKD